MRQIINCPESCLSRGDATEKEPEVADNGNQAHVLGSRVSPPKIEEMVAERIRQFANGLVLSQGRLGIHGVVHRKTTFRHEFFNIAQAERKPQIEPNAIDDHGRLEPPLVEPGRPAGGHGVTLPDPQAQHFLHHEYRLAKEAA